MKKLLLLLITCSVLLIGCTFSNSDSEKIQITATRSSSLSSYYVTIEATSNFWKELSEPQKTELIKQLSEATKQAIEAEGRR
jgi:outer membrane lipoprotein-sorting protein